MRRPVNRYETEIRLALVAIVVLLLLLNFSSNFVLYRIKRQMTGEIDQRLAAALHNVSTRLTKNQSDRLSDDHLRFVNNKYELTSIAVWPLDKMDSPSPISAPDIPQLEEKALRRLTIGERLFRFSRQEGSREGMALYCAPTGKKMVIVAKADSRMLDSIAAASKTTLYLGAAVMLLIIPMTIILPRFILEPFKRMRETAQSAGRLKESPGDDDVTGVIRSYRQVIEELKRNQFELKRLYRESSNKADRLQKYNHYILQSIGSGVITVDLTGKVVGYNRAAGEILGYESEQVVGIHYLAAFPQEIALGLLIEAGLERGEMVGHRELELIREGQPTVWLGILSSQIIDDNDRAVGISLLFNDLTELCILRSELELNRRMAALGEMTAGLAHQLRNSLAAIAGFSQLLQKKSGPSSDLGDIAAAIRTESAASETMVNRFLQFARPLHLSYESLDLQELIERTICRFDNRTEKQDVTINFDRNTEPCSIIGDALLLNETFGNIIDNALQAVPSDGRIDIIIIAGDNDFAVVIADNGPGIAHEVRDQIFTPFYSTKPSGTGLGLALVQKIVHLHHGRIFFDSDAVSGAVCRVVLPAVVQKTETAVYSTGLPNKKV